MFETLKMPRKFCIFTMVLLLCSSLFLGILANTTAEEPVSAYLVESEITDMKRYNEENEVWDFVISVVIETNTAEKYSIFGDMRPSHIDNQALTTGFLSEGRNTVELKFSGNNIYLSEIDGNYIITLTVEFQGQELDRLYYTTKGTYDHLDFKAGDSPVKDFTIGLVSNTVKLQTDVFTAIIYEYTPVIEYYYSVDEGEIAKFKVTYTNLFGYTDNNGDGKYGSGDEVKYSADLVDATWNSNKVLMESFESFDFEITSSVTLESSTSPNVDVDIIFHYSSINYISNSQRKFDIEIKFNDEQTLIGIDGLAIEQIISDESEDRYKHEFVFDEANNIIRFENEDGLQHGYYSWIASADSNRDLGDIPVSASTTMDESGMTLYLSYSYDDSIEWIYHDPEIGIDPENIKDVLEDAAEEILHNPIAYFISALIAGAVVFGSLFRQKKQQ